MQQDSLGAGGDNLAWAKIAVLWFGAWLGTITLSQLVLFATLILTVLQILKTVKEMRKREKLDRIETVISGE